LRVGTAWTGYTISSSDMADMADENARLREEAESLRVKLEATLAECVELKRKSDLASPEVGSLLTSRAASMPY